MTLRALLAWLLLGLLTTRLATAEVGRAWVVDTTDQWRRATDKSNGLRFCKGLAIPIEAKTFYRSAMKSFDALRQAESLVFTQSAAWDNWKKIPEVGPSGSSDAPIFLPIAAGDYWFFAEHAALGQGYHAWRSSDMKTWKHKGVANKDRWATTAEYADGKIYLYFDKPNDQDPHLVIGENLGGRPRWKQIGKVFDDPTHGSDAGVIRTEDGVFHLIYEDWSPINARQHSWDSPLAGHTDSPDGISGFQHGDHSPAIDHRTSPTGNYGTYKHSFTSKEPLTYEIHKPTQNAYGDYTLIKVGERFYIFCDYHPANQPIRIGCFVSDSIDKPFQLVGSFGSGHPDPTVGFAGGRFYLITQRDDYVSPGPWADKVEARAGVDTKGDGKIDQWTTWQQIAERYQRKPDFARLVDAIPAQLDLSDLPRGYGFRFEFHTQPAANKKARPIIDRVRMNFE